MIGKLDHNHKPGHSQDQQWSSFLALIFLSSQLLTHLSVEHQPIKKINIICDIKWNRPN